MPTLLVTGANRGLGREFVRQYASDGWRVHATARSKTAIKSLQAEPGVVGVHLADMTDSRATTALATSLGSETIDLLILNAGVYQPRDTAFGRTNYPAWREVLATNVLGPMAVVESLADHVSRSELRRIVMISSRAGSMAETDGREYVYSSSKAALNSIARSCAGLLRDRQICVVTVSPGWSRTDMGGPTAPLAPEAAIASLRKVIDRLTLADSGRFLDYTGEEIPW